jgi:predicted flap endonuclease-1-like 5' DNA nuclease
MMATRRNIQSATQCPLTGDPQLRAKANQATAKIQAAFPEGMSQPALRALASAGYTRLAQLTKVRAAEIAKLHGMGPKGIRLLREALQAQGLDFAGK